MHTTKQQVSDCILRLSDAMRDCSLVRIEAAIADVMCDCPELFAACVVQILDDTGWYTRTGRAHEDRWTCAQAYRRLRNLADATAE